MKSQTTNETLNIAEAVQPSPYEQFLREDAGREPRLAELLALERGNTDAQRAAIEDARASCALADARQDARLLAILAPRIAPPPRPTPARPAWLPDMPLKPLERRRLNDERLNRTFAKRSRKARQ